MFLMKLCESFSIFIVYMQRKIQLYKNHLYVKELLELFRLTIYNYSKI